MTNITTLRPGEHFMFKNAVVACMKNLRSEIDVWLEACEDDEK